MGRLPYITDIYNIYNIYPFLKMPAGPVFMRVSGKPQSGNFSNLGWQFLELWVAIFRTLGGNFSNFGWQFFELVENSNNYSKEPHGKFLVELRPEFSLVK